MRILLIAFLCWTLCAAAQEASPNPAPPKSEPEQRIGVTPGSDTSLVFNGDTSAESVDVFKPSAAASGFKFTKVDFEYLKQINAFDRYIEEKGWIFDDPVVTGYVERVGASVVPPTPPENVNWRFHVLRDPVPNAFALPNGSIYINTGLLARLQNEAQLAAVLAHESTHAFNRHGYLSYHDMRRKSVAIEIIQVGAMGASYGGVNYGIVAAIGNLVPLAVVESMFGYRRELEHEADMYAVRVLNHDGYDPLQVSKALDSLKSGPEVDLSQESLFWSDHPKLEERVKDTAALAKQFGSPASSSPGRIEELNFIATTKAAVRHDAGLAMLLGRPRTALSAAQRLVALDPNNADDYSLLGDAYRSLGGRSPVPLPEELTDEGKKQARKMLRKMTLAEYDNALLQAPGGKERRASNLEQAERAYSRALDTDPQNANARRGLGFLLEAQNEYADAIVDFTKYLELAPNARDARQVRMHIEALEKKRAADQQPPAPTGGTL